MNTVYIINKNGEPLMPTTRCGYVRILLKRGKARVVKRRPFTVQLLYKTEEAKHVVILGMDAGRTNIGLCAVNEKGKPLLSIKAQTRNKDIPKLMEARKQFRTKHRHLARRRVRRRRANAAGTVNENGFIIRRLPKCKEDVTMHDIKNKEAKFFNRKREDGWLTPTANHLLQTHINLVLIMTSLLPITDIVVELNKFTFMAMDDPNIRRWQYQKGPLYGYGSVEDAVNAQQDGKCLLCGGDIDDYHHIVPQSKGGSDTLSNIAGLCKSCHDVVHKDAKTEAKLKSKKEGMNKKYHALSVLNQIMPYLLAELEEMYPGHVYVTDGRSTKLFRETHGIEKDHHLDAYCIACTLLDEIKAQPTESYYEVRQFRRHDRMVCHKENIDRKYKDADGNLIAMNRHKRMEQKTDSLEEYRLSHNEDDISKLKVEKHGPQYKDMNRFMPGALMRNVKTNKLFVLARSSGRHNGKPDSYVDTKSVRHTASKCVLVKRNTGLVFV